jgi:hypothetical protein
MSGQLYIAFGLKIISLVVIVIDFIMSVIFGMVNSDRTLQVILTMFALTGIAEIFEAFYMARQQRERNNLEE